MPYTSRQLTRILKVGPDTLLGDGLPKSVAVAESFIRRAQFAQEDGLIVDLLDRWKTFYRAMFAQMGDLAAQYGVGRLENDGNTANWRRAALGWIEPRLIALLKDSGKRVLAGAVKAYYAGYFGGGYVLSQSGAKILMPPPSRQAATAKALTGKIKEAWTDTFSPDDMVATLVGQDWIEEFDSIGIDAVTKARRVLSGGMGEGIRWDQAARRLRSELGIERGDRGAFHRTQTIARTYVQGAQNSGRESLYRANRDIVRGVQWWATHDGRTCKDCLSLHGTIWAMDDPSRRTPPYDSHYNCRCALLPALIGGGFPDESPNQTFEEFMISMGLTWLLDQLFNRRGVPVLSDRYGEFEGGIEVDG